MRPSPPPERTLASLARRKELAAEKREREALELRAEAAELRQRWDRYRADRAAASDPTEVAS